jgi:hypothetical protein
VSLAARAAAVAAALLVAAWFGLGVRQAQATKDADAILTTDRTPPPGELRRAADLIGRAATLNPDRAVDLLRARLSLARGDRADARRRYEAVVRDQPDDIEAWTQLAFLTARSDPAAFRRAVTQIRRLSPRVPPP